MTSSGHAHLDGHRYNTSCREPSSDVAENLGKFIVRCVQAMRNDLELIPTAKTETRHPVEGSFGNEFPCICKVARV